MHHDESSDSVLKTYIIACVLNDKNKAIEIRLYKVGQK